MSPDSIVAHREGTGREGRCLHRASVGTGGTLLGIAEALKAVNPGVEIYGVEPGISSLFKRVPEVNSRQDDLRSPCVLAFQGGALTPALDQRDAAPLWFPVHRTGFRI